MQLHVEQTLDLIDAEGRQVGQMVIERSEDNLVFGKFVPGPAFPAVQHLFREFEEAVDLQALSVVDELDTAITALGLHLRSPDSSQRVEIHDVQIWSDGGITCRVGSPNMSTVERDLESRQPIQAVGGRGRLNKPMKLTP
jgi:hypothetical protein